MAKIDLVVADPQTLNSNSGANAQRIQMTYGDTDSPIVIDTETAFIECEAQSKSASIKEWVVDITTHKMKLANDVGEGNYQEIDLASAMSMAGQLVRETGRATLLTLLNTLEQVFGGIGKGDGAGSETSKDNTPEEEATTPQESPESPLPSPVNPEEI